MARKFFSGEGYSFFLDADRERGHSLLMTNATTNTAATMSTADLLHVARVLEADLAAAMARGVRGTQAHVGQFEMLAACGAELDRRGIERGVARDGTDLPVLVDAEDDIRYSVAVLVF